MSWKWRIGWTLTLFLAAAGARADERALTVPADRDWTGSGIRLRAGDRIECRASGEINWGKGVVGPEGSRGASGGFFRPLSDWPLGGLIGRVGTSVFWLGASADLASPADGELELGINDDKFSDNAGDLRVRVRTSGGGSSWGSGSGSGFGSSGNSGYDAGDWGRYSDFDRDDDEYRDRRRDWFWWRGKVDGVDHLVIRGQELRVKHIDKDPIQSQNHRFSAALPGREVDDLRLEVREGRGRARLVQRPSAGNEWTAIVAVDDSDDGGGGWYELLLSWDRRRPSDSGGEGAFIRWRGKVDAQCRVSIRGDKVSLEDRGGKDTVQGFAKFSAPLPSRDVPLSVTKVTGRGKVKLVQTPTRENGYTAVVDIKDEKGGADVYEFALSW